MKSLGINVAIQIFEILLQTGFEPVTYIEFKKSMRRLLDNLKSQIFMNYFETTQTRRNTQSNIETAQSNIKKKMPALSEGPPRASRADRQ